MDNKIFRGVIVSYSLIICNILSVLLYIPFLIRSLGTSDYAVYSVVYAFLNYFVIDFGIGQSLAKFLTDARYRTRSNCMPEQLLGVVFKVYILLAVILAGVFIGLYSHLELIFSGFTLEEMARLRGVYALAAVYTILSFAFMPLEGIFTANELFAELKIFIISKKISTILLTIVVLLLDGGLMWVMIAGTGSDCVVIFGELLFLLKRGMLKISWRYWDIGILLEIMNFSLWIALMGLSQQFIIPITPTILGHFSDSRQVALFSIAMILEQYAYTFSGAIRGMLLPKVARLAYSNDYVTLNAYQIKVGRVQLYIIGLILSGSYVFGREFITLWLGNNYQDSFLLYVLISCSDIITVTLEVAFTILVAESQVKYRAFVYMTGAMVCTSLSAVLSTRYGALGSSIAISLELWIFNVILVVLVLSKKSELKMRVFFKECHLKIVPVLTVYALVWLCVNRFWRGNTWLNFGVKGLAFATFFFLFMWLLCFNEYEKELLLHVMRLIKRKDR